MASHQKCKPCFFSIRLWFKAEPLLIFPEWKVPLPGGSRPSQNDVWILAKNDSGLISITVEGKVEEPFDKTIGEWKLDSSPGKDARLGYLSDILALSSPIPDSVRYQLLHRTASAVIEAERFGASHAVMLVHSFSPLKLILRRFLGLCEVVWTDCGDWTTDNR